MPVSARKPRIGMLLITTPRFRNLGEGTAHGVYHQRKEKEANRIIAAASQFSDVIFPGVVYTRDDVRQAIRRFEQEEVDMVFACFLSWSDDFAWIRFLRDMKPVPVLFASLVRDALGFEDSLNEDRFVEFLSAGSLVGMLEASGSATRFDRPMMQRVIGTLDTVMHTCACFSKAAHLRTALSQDTFGLLPSLNEVMWSTYVDVYDLFIKVGPELRFLSVAALQETIDGLPDEEVEENVRRIMKAYDNDGTIIPEKMNASVAASMALEKMCRDAGVSMLVLNDVDATLLRTIGLRPGFTPCPGTEDISVVPEGDIGGALAVYVLRHLTGLHVPFVEPFHIDIKSGTFAGGHAGPNDYTDPRGKTVLSRDERFARSDYKHAGAPFAWHVISEGEKTMLHISQCNGRFKLVCTVVDALPCPRHLAGYTHGLFRPRKDPIAFFQSLMDIGVTQHYAIADGNHIQTLASFARMMGFDFYEV